MRFLIFAVTLILLPLQADAQSSGDEISVTCNVDQDTFAATLELIEGVWTATSQVGVLYGPGRTVPLPANPEPDWVQFTVEDGVLIGLSPISNDRLVFEYFIGNDWDMTPDQQSAVQESEILDDEDLSVVAGCPSNQLLRLKASGNIIDPGSGQLINYILRLFVVNLDAMYGTTTGSSGGYTAIRALSITR